MEGSCHHAFDSHQLSFLATGEKEDELYVITNDSPWPDKNQTEKTSSFFQSSVNPSLLSHTVQYSLVALDHHKPNPNARWQTRGGPGPRLHQLTLCHGPGAPPACHFQSPLDRPLRLPPVACNVAVGSP